MAPAHIHWLRPAPGDPGANLSGSALFALVWDTLADLFGTAAAAVLLRRAAKRGAAASPDLADLEISFRELAYRYTVPNAWNERAAGMPDGLRALVAELLPLLVELTGPIAVRRLEQIPGLRGLFDRGSEEGSP